MTRFVTAALVGGCIGLAVLSGAAVADAQVGDDPNGSMTAAKRSTYVALDWGPSQPPRLVYHIFVSRNGSGQNHIHSTDDGST